ncbi:MAG: GPR endopeptidase [Ruminococcaceae bacterium]|nr:GPR endopeptidase [Oscillospiraceae bacterium]
MMPSRRTDLAAELDLADRRDVAESTEKRGEFTVSTVEILTEEAADRLGKPCGKYITADIGKIWLASDDSFEKAADLIADKLRLLAHELCGRMPESLLVAGLGNRRITADALGDETVGLLTVTRHIRTRDSRLFGLLGGREISAVAPGVLGQTGIETAELVDGVCRQVKPELVIAIDALCARSTERLATTIQLGSTGISPGSGIGNHRRSIDRETLGVPVIALGVPTVVDSATLVLDALEQAGIDEPDARLMAVLRSRRGYFVTPKETDTIVRELSRLTARAITLAFGGLA